MSFPFYKIVVCSTALLYSAFKNNNQTHGGLGRVCATGVYRSMGNFRNFTREFLLNGKVLCLSLVALKGKVEISERRWYLQILQRSHDKGL